MNTEELRLKMDELSEELEKATKQWQTSLLTDHGVTLGVTLVRHKGKTYTACSFYTSFSSGKPWIRGKAHKKDGKVSDIKTLLYNEWEVLP